MNRNIKENKNIKEIASLMTEMSLEEGYTFLSEILTPAEISTLSKRWRILKMLNEGFSQREIAKDLQVSLCKVTRGAKILKNQESVLAQYLIKENF